MNVEDKEFIEVTESVKPFINEAMKILFVEPAIMTYFSLITLESKNIENLTARLSTKGTGSYAILQYNPYWVEKIKEPSIFTYVLYMETLRLALHHVIQRKCYPLVSYKLSSDLIVSDNKNILNLHKKEVKEVLDYIPTLNDYNDLLSKHNFNKKTDFYLEKLNSILKTIGDKQTSYKEDGFSTDDKDSDNNEVDESLNEDEKEEQENPLYEYFQESPENAEIHMAEWEENNELKSELIEVTKHIVSSSSTWGSLSGGIIQSIISSNTLKFNPETILRKFKMTTLSHNVYPTRLKANRRHGFLFPGYRHENRSKILVAKDCSGSMSDEELEMAIEFVNKFIKTSEVYSCFWDGVCGDITQINKPQKKIDLTGRGSTNPQSVIDKITAEKLKFDGIIFFTDCNFKWEKPKKYSKKILVVTVESPPPSWVRYKISLDDIKKRG